MGILRDFAQEVKRQELIKELTSSGFKGLSDGRTLRELSLSELQLLFKNTYRSD